MTEFNYWKRSQEAEKAFWNKERYTRSHFSKDYWESELKNYCGKIKMDDFAGKDVLEIGCGPKGMIHFISAKKKVGLDPLIEKYKELDILEDGDVTHMVGVGEKIELADKVFDVVICFNVLDHSRIPEDVLKEIYRVLKPRGKLLFHSHCVAWWVGPVRFLLRYIDKPHPWHFFPREIREMIKAAGFKSNFESVSNFHWQARNFIKHIVSKVIIKDYFAILEK